MSQLTLNGKKQSVTTIVTFNNDENDTYILLGRSDPRYRDTTGSCLSGEKLPVGSCKFIGGQVEKDIPPCFLDKLSYFNQLPGPMDRRIIATALKELEEEAGLNAVKYLRSGSHLRLVELLTCKSVQTGKEQDIHYLNLHLGTLSEGEIAILSEQITPCDDMLQTVLMPVHGIEIDDSGEVLLNISSGELKTKDSFDGFPEMDDWNAQFEALIPKLIEDGKYADAIFHNSRRFILNLMHEKLSGLEGLDQNTLIPDSPIPMFKRKDPGVKSDGQILRYLLKI